MCWEWNYFTCMRGTVRTAVVELLIEKLAGKCRVSTNYSGFRAIYEFIDNDEISLKYIDDTWRKVKEAKKKRSEKMGSSRDKLEIMVKALDRKLSLHRFEMLMEEPLHEMLEHCIGNWWSMVRANVGKYIFKAPVRIYKEPDTGEILVKLKGRRHDFIGNIIVRAGCLFLELDSKADKTADKKKLYIVLKGSNIEGPEILQGTYVGISSAGDPIGGRELFMKENNLSFSDMKWQRLVLNNNTEDERINQYFDDKSHPIIGIKKVSAYDLSDLD